MLMAGIALCLQAWAISNNLHWQTIVFNVVCLCQMGHVLAIRSEQQSLFRLGLFSNRPLIAAVLLAFVLQALITYVPFFHTIFKTEALTLKESLVVGITSTLVFLAVEGEKVIIRRRKHNKQSTG
jgi:Ca2+-transporting ATPase